MPKVPTYSDPQVRTEPLPAARLTFNPGNPGAAIGQGLQQLGQGVTNAWTAEQKRQSDIAILDADRQLSAWTTSALNDPQTGALNVKGKDALGLSSTVLPAFDQQTAEVMKGLTNQAQRDGFQRLAAGRRVELDNALMRHASGEMRQFENNELEAYIQTAHDSALANPAGAPDEINRQRLAIASYADRNGLGPKWFDLKFATAASKTHLGVIDGMLAQNQDQQARQYFDAHEPELVGKDRTRAKEAVKVGTLRGDSQRLADNITTQYHDPSAMMAAVEQVKDPELRDQVEERVQRKIRFLHDVNTQAADDAFKTAWDTVEKTGDPYQISPSVWASLAPERRKALEQYAKQKASGQDVINNDAKWLEFRSLTDRQLAETSEAGLMSKYLPVFDRAHREQAMSRWGEVQASLRGDPSAKAKHASTLSFNEIVDTALSQAGVGLKLGFTKKDLGKLDDEHQKIVSDFISAADSAVKQYETTHLAGKRAATSEEMQKIVDGLLLRKVFVENRFLPGGETRPAAMLTDAERKRARWPDAPTDPAQRTAGQTYQTPKGSLTWTGTKWLKN